MEIDPKPNNGLSYSRFQLNQEQVMDDEPVERPATCQLSAYPNPFNPETTISCELSPFHFATSVDLMIFRC